MRTRRKATIEDLRRAIDSLPLETRAAMLDGIRENDIIVGAYTDRGGICPMLAAYRAGGRGGGISFARAWDTFAFGGARSRLARRATRREMLVLRSHLELSLLAEDGDISDLSTAIAQHEQLVRARRVEHPPSDEDRSAELETRSGWAWLRVMRRYDEYERALALVESAGLEPTATSSQRQVPGSPDPGSGEPREAQPQGRLAAKGTA
jgi:hypothetical protein